MADGSLSRTIRDLTAARALVKYTRMNGGYHTTNENLLRFIIIHQIELLNDCARTGCSSSECPVCINDLKMKDLHPLIIFDRVASFFYEIVQRWLMSKVLNGGDVAFLID